MYHFEKGHQFLICRSVHQSVSRSVRHTSLFLDCEVFGLTAPAKMIKWPEVTELKYGPCPAAQYNTFIQPCFLNTCYQQKANECELAKFKWGHKVPLIIFSLVFFLTLYRLFIKKHLSGSFLSLFFFSVWLPLIIFKFLTSLCFFVSLFLPWLFCPCLSRCCWRWQVATS